MKNLILFIISLSFITIGRTQDKYIKWKYKTPKQKSNISVNSKKFYKSNSSDFLLKSKKINIGFWIDKKKWSIKKINKGNSTEFQLKRNGKYLYALIFTVYTKKNILPIQYVREIVLKSMTNFTSNLKIIKEEYRTVNNIKVLFMQINGISENVKFSYYGYCYCGKKGIVQFMTYTTQILMRYYKKDCEEILNGIVRLD